jgi:hypothetical protein
MATTTASPVVPDIDLAPVPSSASSIGTIAYPMFLSRRGW